MLISYFGTGIKGDISTRDYEISIANGDDFDLKGWYVANNQAGTPLCINRFCKWYHTSGNTGGSHDAVVVEHLHGLKYNLTGVTADGVQVIQGIPGGNESNTESSGVSGVGMNQPSYITSIPIIRMS